MKPYVTDFKWFHLLFCWMTLNNHDHKMEGKGAGVRGCPPKWSIAWYIWSESQYNPLEIPSLIPLALFQQPHQGPCPSCTGWWYSGHLPPARWWPVGSYQLPPAGPGQTPPLNPLHACCAQQGLVWLPEQNPRRRSQDYECWGLCSSFSWCVNYLVLNMYKVYVYFSF